MVFGLLHGEMEREVLKPPRLARIDSSYSYLGKQRWRAEEGLSD